jgi:hypothetical protein
MHLTRISALVFAASVAVSLPAWSEPVAPNAHPLRCFYSTEFENWKAPDARTIFIRVRPRRYFRLDLTGACSLLTFPDSHLVTRFRGSDTICSALDWDLKVAESSGGIGEACIVRAMTELTPEEVAAIPKRFQP